MEEHLRSLQRQLLLLSLSSTLTLAFSERAWAGQGDMQTVLLALAFIVAIVVILAVIFIPTIVAFRRQHPNRWLIFVVNLAFVCLISQRAACLMHLSPIGLPLVTGSKRRFQISALKETRTKPEQRRITHWQPLRKDIGALS